MGLGFLICKTVGMDENRKGLHTGDLWAKLGLEGSPAQTAHETAVGGGLPPLPAAPAAMM